MEKVKLICECGHEWEPRKPLEKRKWPLRCSECGASGDSIELVERRKEISKANRDFARKRAKLLRRISEKFKELTGFLPEQFEVGASGPERSDVKSKKLINEYADESLVEASEDLYFLWEEA